MGLERAGREAHVMDLAQRGTVARTGRAKNAPSGPRVVRTTKPTLEEAQRWYAEQRAKHGEY